MFEKKPQKLTERERQIQTALRERCAVLGKKFQILFWISILSVILSVLMFVLAYATQSKGVVTVFAVIAIVLGVIYAATLFTLGKFIENFKLAAITYILLQISDFIKQISSSNFFAYTIFSVASLGLGIGYVLKYTYAMEESIISVDGYIADSWASYRKAYIGVMIASLICVIMAFAPAFAFLAMIASVILSIVAIVLSVWQLVILYRSGKRMIEFSNSSVEG